MGPGETGILSRPLEHFTEWLGDRKNAAFGHFMTLVHHVSYGVAGLKIEKFRSFAPYILVTICKRTEISLIRSGLC